MVNRQQVAVWHFCLHVWYVLLSHRNVENIIVIVTRWFGGVKLGPERFKLINRAARAAIEKTGVLGS